jgi:CDP-glucose 4,6-dehydratase
MFNGIYKGKKVLITGNTGFKGSWLTVWLLKLGAKVYGLSKDIPTKPSMFEELDLNKKTVHFVNDDRDLNSVLQIINDIKPDFIFHLAAQAIVTKSYSDPVETLSTNIMGTTNILEALRLSKNRCIGIIITSDKCYDNVEWIWGYRENDRLGGKDIYSGSKGAAELVIKSYYHSFFKHNDNIRIASARAGNVIGGGDWAQDRIVPDCMRAWSNDESVEIRNPNSTRPWQHVLEPLSGYLTIGWKLFESDELNGENFNFGPDATLNHTVKDLIFNLGKSWNLKNSFKECNSSNQNKFYEAKLLKLNCDKALFFLKWISTLDFVQLIRFTSEWYYSYYNINKNMLDLTLSQIDEYEQIAKSKGIIWTK